MITASLFKNGQNQAIRIPKGLEFIGVNQVEIRQQGNSIILTPVRKNWVSFSNIEYADEDFLIYREIMIEDDRVNFNA